MGVQNAMPTISVPTHSLPSSRRYVVRPSSPGNCNSASGNLDAMNWSNGPGRLVHVVLGLLTGHFGGATVPPASTSSSSTQALRIEMLHSLFFDQFAQLADSLMKAHFPIRRWQVLQGYRYKSRRAGTYGLSLNVRMSNLDGPRRSCLLEYQARKDDSSRSQPEKPSGPIEILRRSPGFTPIASVTMARNITWRFNVNLTGMALTAFHSLSTRCN